VELVVNGLAALSRSFQIGSGNQQSQQTSTPG
jgi:hypothetical protein